MHVYTNTSIWDAPLTAIRNTTSEEISALGAKLRDIWKSYPKECTWHCRVAPLLVSLIFTTYSRSTQISDNSLSSINFLTVIFFHNVPVNNAVRNIGQRDLTQVRGNNHRQLSWEIQTRFPRRIKTKISEEFFIFSFTFDCINGSIVETGEEQFLRSSRSRLRAKETGSNETRLPGERRPAG